jgi:hypothetical protein
MRLIYCEMASLSCTILAIMIMGFNLPPLFSPLQQPARRGLRGGYTMSFLVSVLSRRGISFVLLNAMENRGGILYLITSNRNLNF